MSDMSYNINNDYIPINASYSVAKVHNFQYNSINSDSVYYINEMNVTAITLTLGKMIRDESCFFCLWKDQSPWTGLGRFI